MSGPLANLRVVLAGGIGPAPYCAMLLADLGADVVRIDRQLDGSSTDPLALPVDVFSRGQRSIILDLKRSEDVEIARSLSIWADVLIEGFRPGVMEKLGLGPRECVEHNERLVYARVTGWGHDGPLGQAPGHDINYIALTGALDAIGHAGGPPAVPLNLLGDFAGGGQQLLIGILAALLERTGSGRGQVVEAAMVDGVASLMTMNHALTQHGRAAGSRGENLLGGGAPFYSVYECADGRYLAVGAMEPAFYGQLLELCGLSDPAGDADRFDVARWPEWRNRFADVFRCRTRDAWCEHPLAWSACVSPVLEANEVPQHPHHIARGSFTTLEGVVLPAPAPHFSRTPCDVPGPFARPGADRDSVLEALANRIEGRQASRMDVPGQCD